MRIRSRSALAGRRELAGHTQESLAAVLNVDRSTIHRWESGKSLPRPWQRARLADELGIDAAQLQALLQDQEAPSGLQAQPDGSPAVHQPLKPPAESGTGRFSLGSSETLVADWAASHHTTGLTSHQLWVTRDDIDVADSRLGMFRQLDHTHGAGPYAAQLATYIDTELAALLVRPAADKDTVRERARVATGFLELAGYQAVDSGDPARAQAYYQRALALTTATSNHAYGAYLVAVNLGHLALHCEQPRTALQWTQAATAAAGTASSPATRAAITAVRARAHARMGQEAEASALLHEADLLLDSSVPTDEPPWIGYFTAAYLADEAAHCLHDLGRPPAARIQLSDALEGVGRDKVRRLAIDAALLASTWLRTGDLDEACAAGRQAVSYAARTSSGRCVHRVADVLAQLAPHADYAAVAELREYARHVLPAADQAASATGNAG
ncbi:MULTISPECIES: helix-turn-helix transcriptional regulator [unclassified Kitasatospora]|uniref:helix-turn-helix domain-containing protein n=1 Tax=unclassified Kitasatospora TaxID=2633591 RepID=UPI00070E1474|nr:MULTISPECIES: helix-turn-helix transcriptional regulator [unclassified Kitasatospora]KQV20849.1 hypothetical protein ASC99_20280 [Kitasatospora sp. Root107]KRB60496.1 hypothetical protein ASE03_12900 [Kitasatospora sp. Root187]